MKSLFLVLLLAVLSVRNDAAEIRDLQHQKTSLVDSDVNIPEPIDFIIREEEFLDNFDSDQKSSSQDVSAILRSNLDVGSISFGDRELYRGYFSRSALPNIIRSLDINFDGASSSRITAIRATEQGASQGATAAVTSGGIGWRTATIRLQSAPSRGFYYLLEIYGRTV